MTKFVREFSASPINEFLIREGAVYLPGINNLYIGSIKISELHLFNAQGQEVPISELYVGNVLVWQA